MLTATMTDGNGDARSVTFPLTYVVYHGYRISRVQDLRHFVDPDDVNVTAIADPVLQATSAASPEKKLAALVEAVSALGLDYVFDPILKFEDHVAGVAARNVASPSETLYLGGGDCKDFTVLSASIFMRAGFSTDVVVVPGHVLMGVRIRLDPADKLYASRIKPPEGIKLEEGESYIAIESTMFSTNLIKREGYESVAALGKELVLNGKGETQFYNVQADAPFPRVKSPLSQYRMARTKWKD